MECKEMPKLTIEKEKVNLTWKIGLVDRARGMNINCSDISERAVEKECERRERIKPTSKDEYEKNIREE